MSTSNRNVRLGIVYRSNIIQEEVLDRRIDVSVGLRAGSTVQVSPKDHPDFPDNLEVLILEGNQYYLVVPSDPTARIGLRGAAASETRMVRGKRCIPVEGVAGGSLVERLSDRELEVFGLIGQGRGTRPIADQLHLSVKTIESHRAHIKEKLNLKSATELVHRAIQMRSEQTA